MLNMPLLSDIPIKILLLLVAFPIHEFAHAWTANRLGDDTPRLAGRLTLNPLAHLDILGSLMILVSFVGWAKPVPVNPYALQRRTPAGMMIVAAAGPISNVALAVLVALPFQLGLVSSTGSIVGGLLASFIFLNLILFFFNLIPIFPLDGEKVLAYFLPPGGQALLAQVRPYGPILLVLVIVLGAQSGLNLLDWLVRIPAASVLHLLVS